MLKEKMNQVIKMNDNKYFLIDQLTNRSVEVSEKQFDDYIHRLTLNDSPKYWLDDNEFENTAEGVIVEYYVRSMETGKRIFIGSIFRQGLNVL